MQFSTTEEHVRLVERVKALLARSSPGVSLGELHRPAMQLLVDRLEQQKFGAPAGRPVDGGDQRCAETRYLELHHLKPFAQGGEHVASNLALRCAAHDALAAEADFGRSVIAPQRDATGHDSLAALQRQQGK